MSNVIIHDVDGLKRYLRHKNVSYRDFASATGMSLSCANNKINGYWPFWVYEAYVLALYAVMDCMTLLDMFFPAFKRRCCDSLVCRQWPPFGGGGDFAKQNTTVYH